MNIRVRLCENCEKKLEVWENPCYGCFGKKQQEQQNFTNINDEVETAFTRKKPVRRVKRTIL